MEAKVLSMVGIVLKKQQRIDAPAQSLVQEILWRATVGGAWVGFSWHRAALEGNWGTKVQRGNAKMDDVIFGAREDRQVATALEAGKTLQWNSLGKHRRVRVRVVSGVVAWMIVVVLQGHGHRRRMGASREWCHGHGCGRTSSRAFGEAHKGVPDLLDFIEVRVAGKPTVENCFRKLHCHSRGRR